MARALSSGAEAIFARFSAASIRRMVGNAQENHLLDFKLIGKEDLSSRDDKRNLAVALSGFSNADGGVILWGVDARRDPSDNSVDQVIAAPGVAQPKVLLARLTDLTAQACLPAPVGVEHRIVSGRSGPSYVATFVPESNGGPHMAKLGEDRYYTRSGGSFLRLEHFQIGDMFGRRPRPILTVSALKVEPFRFKLRITNEGRGPARAPFLMYWPPAPFYRNSYGVDGNLGEHLPLIATHGSERILHAGGADFVVHPTMSVDLGGIWLGFDPSQAALARAREVTELRYRVGALDGQPVDGVLKLDPGS